MVLTAMLKQKEIYTEFCSLLPKKKAVSDCQPEILNADKPGKNCKLTKTPQKKYQPIRISYINNNES